MSPPAHRHCQKRKANTVSEGGEKRGRRHYDAAVRSRKKDDL